MQKNITAFGDRWLSNQLNAAKSCNKVWGCSTDGSERMLVWVSQKLMAGSFSISHCRKR